MHHLHYNLQIECGSALSVVLSTTILIITMVKILWTHNPQPSESTTNFDHCDEECRCQWEYRQRWNHIRFVFYVQESDYFRASPTLWHKERASIMCNFPAIWLIYFAKWTVISDWLLQLRDTLTWAALSRLLSTMTKFISQSDCGITSLSLKSLLRAWRPIKAGAYLRFP